MLHYLKKILQETRVFREKPVYLSAQKYQVTFSVQLKNSISESQKVTLVMPLPAETAYQKIEALGLKPEGYNKKSEKKAGNRYAFWESTIEPQQTLDYEIACTAQVLPRVMTLRPEWTMQDYTAIKNTPDYYLYLSSNHYLDGVDPRIKKLSSEIVGSARGLAEIVSLLNDAVIKKLTYGNPILGLYSFGEALEKEKMDCGGFDALLGSLLKAEGIPARIISGFWTDSQPNTATQKMHAWLEILLPNNTWFPLDPSIEQLRKNGRTKKFGGVGNIGSDRLVFSVGEDFMVTTGNENLPLAILQNPVIIPEKGLDSITLKTDIVTESNTSQ